MEGRPLAALWLRVSDRDQQTVDNQEAPLRELAERRGLEIVTVYRVEGSAWRGKHHPALERLYSDASRGSISAVIVWALDRLSREGIFATAYTLRRLAAAGVRVISLQEPWVESMDGVRDLLVAVMAWVAGYESERRSERTRAGLERARRAGVTLGRPKGSRDRGARRRRSDRGLRRLGNGAGPTGR